MKLSTLALVAATVALPAAAFADSSQPNSSPGAAAPATQMQKNQGAKSGTTGAPAADSSVPGATNPNTSPAKSRTTGSGGAGDSSVPGATNPNPK